MKDWTMKDWTLTDWTMTDECAAPYTAADAAADTTCEVRFMTPHPQHIEVTSIFISPYMAAQ